MSFHAEVIADSKNLFGQRLTSFVITFPRYILAEFNTHRVLSRNSASSRAIPFAKMVKMVDEHPFIPMKWMKDHKGMQGTEYFEDPADIEWFTNDWISSSKIAIEEAKRKHERGLSKQVCNRILEPYMWHTAIVTASEWGNYFALRVHEAAEIHIDKIAGLMLEAYNASTPRELQPGEWHIPFGDKFDHERVKKLITGCSAPPEVEEQELQQLKVKIATARCARVSYLNFEGKDDYNADIQLHDNLSQSGHWSPFEHCARAMSKNEMSFYTRTDVDENGKVRIHPGWCGNFCGFIQHRKFFANENKTDPRVLAK